MKMSEAVKEVIEEKKLKDCCHKKTNKIKISDLPLYGNPYPRCERVESQELGYIESGVKTVREGLKPYLSVAANASERVGDILVTGFEHSKSTYQMISSEGNTVAKAAAITGGGLIGLLLASRKGFFKKLMYTSVGLTAASAVCYPKEAKELSQIGFFIVTTKGPEIIKEYSGIDLTHKKETKPKSMDTIGQEVSDVHYYGFRVSEGGNKSEPKPDVISSEKNKSEVKGDFGMSRKEDRDLYANRSSK